MWAPLIFRYDNPSQNLTALTQIVLTIDLFIVVNTPNLQARKQRLEGKLSASLSRSTPVIAAGDNSGSGSSSVDVQAAVVDVAMTYFSQVIYVSPA